MIRFSFMTLFPEMIENVLSMSIIGKAVENKSISLDYHNIRDYSLDKHNKVDDYPYGGGAGMLMQSQPIYDCFQAIIHASPSSEKRRVIYCSPQGKTFNQNLAKELAKEEHLILLCGHYEGIDERVIEEIVTDEISIGDYVLTGGELPAMVIADSVSRMVPGVLHNEESGDTESFMNGLLEYPQYTRPEIWNGKKVPHVLTSGNHVKIDDWRLRQSLIRTKEKRPDLYDKWMEENT